MSIIKRKKKSVIPSGDDYNVLSSSVDDLSKQTSELLSHFGEPKKDEVKSNEVMESSQVIVKKQPVKKGKSFDIIATPTKKVVVKKHIASNLDSKEELLPEHAGKSFNEPGYEEMAIKESSSTEPLKASSDEKNPHEVPVEISSAISSRPPGSLHFQEAVSDSTTNLVDEKEESTSEVEVEIDKKIEPSSRAVISPLSGDEESNSQDEVNSVNDETNKPEVKLVDSDEATMPDQKTILSEQDSDGGELYVNNLVKSSDKKGYTAPEGQQKPTVFDTNEYHPQLHDWSKLESRNGAKSYILALVLVIAGALAYLILSGTEIPFIGKIF